MGLMSNVTPRPITGYGVCNALGRDRAEVLANLREGRSGLRAPPFALPFKTLSGVVSAELPEIPAELRAWSNRPARIAAHLVSQIDAPLQRARERWRPDRIGILLGTSTAGADATESAYAHYLQHGTLPDGYDFRKQHTFGALVEVVRHLTGARGPSWVVSTTCTSSAKPLASALRMIATDVLDAAIVGGIDTLCAMTLSGFHSLGALAADRCRPFSSERTGINIGEGGAFMVVERDGEGPAILEAAGESSDAYHISAPHPDGLGATLAIQRALSLAGCSPRDVDYVNAHGTGTPLNDVAESKAISAVLGNDVPVVSTKGYTGHALGGAGAIEAVLSMLALEEGFIPVSLGCDPIDPKVEVNVVREPIERKVRRVMSNSFAFGGNNIAVLLRAP
jgi:3-oxoacyl-[acyl-carrier-protein] synthase-1